MIRNKPRKSEKKIEEPKRNYDVIEITDPRKLPERYIVVREDQLKNLDQINDKLIRWEMRMVRPIKVHKLTRLVKSIEFCIPLEKVS